MRVTKAIREFIHEEVEKRLEVRYAGEAEEASRQEGIRDKVMAEALRQATELYNQILDSAVAEYEFLEKKEGCELSQRYCTKFDIKNRYDSANVVNWSTRMYRETEAITKKIQVELELGGTKKELMDMLDKI